MNARPPARRWLPIVPLMLGVGCTSAPASQSSSSGGSTNRPSVEQGAMAGEAGVSAGGTQSSDPTEGGAGNDDPEASPDAGASGEDAGGAAGDGAGPAPVEPVEPRPPPPVGDCVEFALNFQVQCESVSPGAITEESCARDVLHYEGLGCRTSWNLFVACASYTTMNCITLSADSCEAQQATYEACQQDFETSTACERQVDSDSACPEDTPYAFSCASEAPEGCIELGEQDCCPPPDPYSGTPDAEP